ncbi:MAG: hypothetical protein Q9227_009099 [Pyrenula ochraceoflavens]
MKIRKSGKVNPRLRDGDTGNCLESSEYITFWLGNSPLSNHYLGEKFSGAEPLKDLVDRLDAISKYHPPIDSLSSRLLGAHNYNCGEQWLMACKAWYFQKLTVPEEALPSLSPENFETLRGELYQGAGADRRAWPKWKLNIYSSSLCQILRLVEPRKQKAEGRNVSGFSENVWNTVSPEVCIVATIARAKADDNLARIFRRSGTRKFVEGSPSDRTWGVGIRYNDPRILDPDNWQGQNRLGRCHDETRDILMADEAFVSKS